MKPAVARHRTAVTRFSLSRPVQLAVEHGIINEETDVFDYGCGRGNDVRLLARRGIRCWGWDPTHLPFGDRGPADVVNLGYVINVIEELAERVEVLREAWTLARKVLVVAARLTLEARAKTSIPYEDGCLTARQTFQKYYDQDELRQWIETILGVPAVAAAPGVFYAFRDASSAQRFLASRFRRPHRAPRERLTERIFEEHRPMLERLMQFVAERGRLPEESELDLVRAICDKLGTLKHAWHVIERVSGGEAWARIREDRSQDLLIYFALARLGRRLRFADLPHEVQRDVRAFFGTYSRVTEEANRLLFSAGDLAVIDKACENSPVGKLTPDALYIHVSARGQLPAILRVYEGCARSYVGAVEAANIVKLHRRKAQISYLSYPDFDRQGHPALVGALVVSLHKLRVDYRDYSAWPNPPILHRKETFVADDYPLRLRFARLTSQEERARLYENPELIGTRDGWRSVLDVGGVEVRGHRVFRMARHRVQPRNIKKRVL